GRFLITLKGVARFDIAREPAREELFRQVVPDWQAWRGDLEEDEENVDRERMVAALGPFFERHGITAESDVLKSARSSTSSTPSPWHAPSARARNKPCSRRAAPRSARKFSPPSSKCRSRAMSRPAARRGTDAQRSEARHGGVRKRYRSEIARNPGLPADQRSADLRPRQAGIAQPAGGPRLSGARRHSDHAG